MHLPFDWLLVSCPDSSIESLSPVTTTTLFPSSKINFVTNEHPLKASVSLFLFYQAYRQSLHSRPVYHPVYIKCLKSGYKESNTFCFYTPVVCENQKVIPEGHFLEKRTVLEGTKTEEYHVERGGG